MAQNMCLLPLRGVITSTKYPRIRPLNLEVNKITTVEPLQIKKNFAPAVSHANELPYVQPFLSHDFRGAHSRITSDIWRAPPNCQNPSRKSSR
jgi:hypothetical protein